LQLKRNPLHYAIATVTSATTFNQKKKVAKVLFLPFLCLLLHFFGVAFDTNPCSDRPLLRPCISSGTDGAASSTTVTLLPVCVLLPDGSHLGKCSSCWGGGRLLFPVPLLVLAPLRMLSLTCRQSSLLLDALGRHLVGGLLLFVVVLVPWMTRRFLSPGCVDDLSLEIC
jgi:hypothetical protein